MTDWVGYARDTLERDGYRLSAPRSAVVETLATLGCSVTAKEIADRLRDRGQDIGVASIYRALELLDKLRLTRRVDAAEGVARYEPVNPDGEHHHHIVCDTCGEVTAFEDSDLERAIEVMALVAVGAFDASPITPALYRVGTAGTGWVQLEINAAEGPDGALLIIGRHGGDLVTTDRLALVDGVAHRNELGYEADRLLGDVERRPGWREMWDAGSCDRILARVAWFEAQRDDLLAFLR